MSNLPAWKRALLEKKKQQEQEEEIKKKQEQEAYIKSLPAWKRAIIMRDMEKNKSASSPSSAVSGNAPISAAGGKDKWKAALSVSQNSKASPSPAKPAESPAAKTNGPLAGSVGARGAGQLPAISRESTSSAKPPWVRTDSPTSPTSPAKPNPPTSVSTTDAPSPRTLREQKRGAVQSLAGQFRRPASSSPPPVSPGFRGKKETTPQPKVEVIKKEPTQSQGGKQDVLNSPQPAPAATVQIDDSDLVGLPSWKRALILKKRMKQAGLTSLPPAQQSQPGNNATPTSSGRDETDAGTPLSPKAAPSKSNSTSSSSSKPNVVNRSDDSVDPGSNKLLQKEGVTLRPPIFNEVDQWANVTTDDPKFVKLPPWKQAMILRRRKDIAKRSGQETSPPESPTVKTVSEKRKGSTPSDSGQSQGKKSAKKPTAKTSGKIEEKRSTSKAPTKSEDKKTSTNKTKGKDEGEETSKTSTGKKSSSGGRLKPVRSAPTRPPEKKEKEVPKVEVAKVEVPKVEEDKEEPMFTWSFSKHSVETGDAMSASSDSELEDVQITSIDDELSDEDDSGIGGSGGTILMSYKPLEEERDTKEKSESPQRARSMSSSSSDPEIKTTMTRSESKSILADPAKKSYKVSITSASCLAVDLYDTISHPCMVDYCIE